MWTIHVIYCVHEREFICFVMVIASISFPTIYTGFYNRCNVSYLDHFGHFSFDLWCCISSVLSVTIWYCNIHSRFRPFSICGHTLQLLFIFWATIPNAVAKNMLLALLYGPEPWKKSLFISASHKDVNKNDQSTVYYTGRSFFLLFKYDSLIGVA